MQVKVEVYDRRGDTLAGMYENVLYVIILILGVVILVLINCNETLETSTPVAQIV